MYHGDIRLGDTIDIKFSTRAFSTGAPTTLAGTPVISAYPSNSTTELTAGITLSVDFDTRTGLNNIRVVATSGNGYATATNYTLVVTTGTVGGVSVVGECVGSFSIECRSALMPATAARTLVVDASGLADANAVKVGPTGAGTAQTARDIGASVLLSSGTGAGQISLAAGLVTVGTNNDKTGYALTQTFPTNFSALAITAGGAVTAGTVSDKTGYSLTQTFPANFSALAITVGGAVTVGTNGDKTGYGIAASAVNAIWDEPTASHTTAGTMGKALGSAGAAADPWTTALPGAYGAGTAGFLIGTYVNASISAVKAKTDNLPATPAATGDAMTLTAGERTSVADALLGRNVAGGSSAGRLVKEALYVLRNKTDIAAATLTVYGVDDTTPAFTAAVQTTAGNPISQIDPA